MEKMYISVSRSLDAYMEVYLYLKIFENISDEDNFFDSVLKQSDNKEIRAALQRVSEKYRAILILRFFEEKSYTEISDIVQIPEGTVATCIARGKKQLKDILSTERTTP